MTASSTVSCRGCTSTSGCSSWPRTTSLPLLERATVPGDLRQQPRRVLHGPGRGHQAPDRGRRRRTRRERTAPAPAARAAVGRQPRPDGAPCPGVQRAGDPRAARPGHRDRALVRARPRRAEGLQEALQGADLPGAHAARRRPRAPVPLHLRALAQPRRRGAPPQDQDRALRPGQGAADLQPVRVRRQPALRAARGRHRRAPQEALPGHGGAAGAHLPGHPQRGPRGRGGRHGEPPQGPREGAPAPQVRSPGAARGRGVDRREDARAAHLRARRQPARRSHDCPARSTCAACTPSPTCRATT